MLPMFGYKPTHELHPKKEHSYQGFVLRLNAPLCKSTPATFFIDPAGVEDQYDSLQNPRSMD
jgi:hypothetical protein